MANPLVSIVMPTYNRASLISRAVKSILRQSNADFELIIVDDGSSDNTDRIISGIKDDRIRYFRFDVNKGQNPALNFGITQVSGEYIAFLDSDDEWLPDFLEKALLKFNENNSLGAVYTRAFGCTNSDVLYDGYLFELEGDIYKEVLKQGYLSYMITIIVKKTIIELLKPYPFDPTFIYGQDDDFCFRIAKICRIGLVKEPLAIIHNDGAIKGSEPSISRNAILVAEGRQKLLNKYKEDILFYCGKNVMASKYLILSNLYFKAGNLDQAKFLASLSYNLNKSFKSKIQLVYYNSSFIRWFSIIYLNLYRFILKQLRRLKRLLFPR